MSLRASGNVLSARSVLGGLLEPGERGDRLHAALFLTHDFNGPYFERAVLARLRDHCPPDTRVPVLVLCDPRQQGRGRRAPGYRVQKVVLPPGGRFHPKVFVALYRDALVCAVGSGNLTPGGLAANAELFSTMTVSRRSESQDPDQGLGRFLRQLREKVSLPDADPESPTSGLEALDRIIERLGDAQRRRFNADATLIRSSFDQPAWESLKREVRRPTRAWIVTPFFDPDMGNARSRPVGKWLDRLAGSLGSRLAVFSRDDSPVHRWAMARPAPRPRALALRGGEGWPVGRMLHAKAYVLTDGDRYHAILGSPNATERGLGGGWADNWRVETWMERRLGRNEGRRLVETLGLGFDEAPGFWTPVTQLTEPPLPPDTGDIQADLLDARREGGRIVLIIRQGADCAGPTLTVELCAGERRERVVAHAVESRRPGLVRLECQIPAGFDVEWVAIGERAWPVQDPEIRIGRPVQRQARGRDRIESFFLAGVQDLPEPIDVPTSGGEPRGPSMAKALAFLDDDRHGALDQVVRASGLTFFEGAQVLCSRAGRGAPAEHEPAPRSGAVGGHKRHT